MAVAECELMRFLVYRPLGVERFSIFTLRLVSFIRSYFFFQAEDGIRDWSVTGVQTCALPISSRPFMCTGWPAVRTSSTWPASLQTPSPRIALSVQVGADAQSTKRNRYRHGAIQRSEERRVGKECRSRWAR